MKKRIMITAPVSSASGYGAHARDLVRSLIAHNKYDIYIEDTRWGACPRNALDKNNTSDSKILECFLSAEHNLTEQPEIYIDIRIPNEFRQIGKYNIGITAGTETDTVSGQWIDGCNKMDLIIVPSEHSKKGFTKSVYDKLQNLPNGETQKIGEVKLEKPIEVLFEGSDTEIYKPLHYKDIDTEFFDWLNDEVPEKFAFLMVGQWGKGGYGEDRKDIGKTVKVFYETFANKKKQPALILKTHGVSPSIMDREECLEKIRAVKAGFQGQKLPNVYLLHGSLTDTEMNYLYNHPKIKSLVSFTHGEGFGRPMLEATMTGLPVIAPNWSGQVDFLDSELSLLIGGELKPIPESAVWDNILIKDSKWFNIDEKNAFLAMNFVFSNHNDVSNKAKKLMNRNIENFSLEMMTNKFDEIMEKYTASIQVPQKVEFKLPKLNKSKLPLPKLKKIEKNTEVVANE